MMQPVRIIIQPFILKIIEPFQAQNTGFNVHLRVFTMNDLFRFADCIPFDFMPNRLNSDRVYGKIENYNRSAYHTTSRIS
jgi:hypothetical protein